MKRVSKKYIWILVIILLFGNALLGGVSFFHRGARYSFSVIEESGAISSGIISKLDDYIKFRIPLIFEFTRSVFSKDEIIIFYGFHPSDNYPYTSSPAFSVDAAYDQGNVGVIESVVLSEAYIQQAETKIQYDILEQYPADKRIFRESHSFKTTFDIGDGDILYIKGVINMCDGTQLDFSTKYRVNKVDSENFITFYLLYAPFIT